LVRNRVGLDAYILKEDDDDEMGEARMKRFQAAASFDEPIRSDINYISNVITHHTTPAADAIAGLRHT
jgi:hypothetical protein